MECLGLDGVVSGVFAGRGVQLLEGGVSEPRNREEVMDLMLRARTLEECNRARELALRWIEEHPADQDYILLAGEHLERVRQALLEKEDT